MAALPEFRLKINVDEFERALHEYGMVKEIEGEYFILVPELLELLKSNGVKVGILPDGPPDGG